MRRRWRWSKKSNHYLEMKSAHVNEENVCFLERVVAMRKEDGWLIIVVVFAIVWTMAFGWGVFG